MKPRHLSQKARKALSTSMKRRWKAANGVTSLGATDEELAAIGSVLALPHEVQRRVATYIQDRLL